MVVELAARIPAQLLGREAADDASGPLPAGADAARTTAREMLMGMGLNQTRSDKLLDDALTADEALAEDPLGWVKKALTRLG